MSYAHIRFRGESFLAGSDFCTLALNSVLRETTMWYALLLLVNIDSGLGIYTVDSIHTSEAECLSMLTTEHRGEGLCTPVHISFPEMGPTS